MFFYMVDEDAAIPAILPVLILWAQENLIVYCMRSSHVYLVARACCRAESLLRDAPCVARRTVA